MLFIRTTLLLGLGVLILPTDQASQARVTSAAKTAMTWTTTFCDRNPATCVQGQQAWGVFVEKAQFGAKMAFELISEHKTQTAAAQTTPATGLANRRAAVSTVTSAAVARSRNTLQPADLTPAWRGDAKRAGG